MVAGEHKFHPECFCCGLCSAFIGDGDSYALVERSKLYWYVFLILSIFTIVKLTLFLLHPYLNIFFSGQCYKRQMQPLQKTTKYPFTRKPHSIRLVEIPSGQKGIKLSADPIGTTPHCLTISQ